MMSSTIKRIFATTIFLIVLPFVSLAQEIPSPVGLWCFVCEPADRVSGSVRTLLTSVRREKIHFNTTVKTYNRQGRVVDFIAYSFGEFPEDMKLIIDTGTTYKPSYDSKGKLVKEEMYFTGNPNLVSSTKYLYDRNGRLSETSKLNSEGTLSRKHTFTYEPENQIITVITTFYENGRARNSDKTILTYNAKGQWVKQAFFFSGKTFRGFKEFSYNEQGDITKNSHYDENGKYLYADVFTYKYDSHGNWYEKHDMETNVAPEGKLMERPDWEITFRVLTYFDDK